MLDDKTVTDKNIEDKSVQEVMAEAKKVCCRCGEELPLSRFRMEIRPNGKKAYRSSVSIVLGWIAVRRNYRRKQ